MLAARVDGWPAALAHSCCARAAGCSYTSAPGKLCPRGLACSVPAALGMLAALSAVHSPDIAAPERVRGVACQPAALSAVSAGACRPAALSAVSAGEPSPAWMPAMPQASARSMSPSDCSAHATVLDVRWSHACGEATHVGACTDAANLTPRCGVSDVLRPAFALRDEQGVSARSSDGEPSCPTGLPRWLCAASSEGVEVRRSASDAMLLPPLLPLQLLPARCMHVSWSTRVSECSSLLCRMAWAPAKGLVSTTWFVACRPSGEGSPTPAGMTLLLGCGMSGEGGACPTGITLLLVCRLSGEGSAPPTVRRRTGWGWGAAADACPAGTFGGGVKPRNARSWR
eukprot:358113-Chlamydomonas_euryale.AAC.2